ncbi:MAG: hypothetical protein AAF725_25570 [Acidobacteriota bacterium]
MTSRHFTLFAIFLTLLLASAAVAEESAEAAAAPALEEAAPERIPASPEGEPAGCGLAASSGLFGEPISAVDLQDAQLLCDCNSDQDCSRRCGEGGGTCFIGPVCSNWPTFTGTCLCKIAEPFPSDAG